MPLEDIKQVRLDKLNALRKDGIDPYPSQSWRTHRIATVIENFDSMLQTQEHVVLCGRILAIREHGGSCFLDVQDGSAKIQAYLKKDMLGQKEYDRFISTTDIGDIGEFYGKLFITKRNEKSIVTERFRMLTKTLLPLPEKWHGLVDVEERFRRRYLDLMLNDDLRQKFKMRAKIISQIRHFMDNSGFVEVTTPTLQPLYGGASARPFKTHMNALDIDLFLRIAPELYLKRLLVGGFEAVYEFTTNFRNEGMDRDHNPEFSAMEFYVAYKDHIWAMEFTEKMLLDLVKTVKDGTSVSYQGHEVRFVRPFWRFTFSELIWQHLGLKYSEASEDEFRAKAKELGIIINKNVPKAGIADELFKKAIRPKLIDPTFVTEYPVELLPLAKRLEDERFVGAFQFFAGGLELIKAFTELNDPIDQEERFSQQEDQRAKGDQEAQRMDEDFIQALEYGVPPAAGWGIGIDRLVALMTDSHSIREIILFPTMKPQFHDEQEE